MSMILVPIINNSGYIFEKHLPLIWLKFCTELAFKFIRLSLKGFLPIGLRSRDIEF